MNGGIFTLTQTNIQIPDGSAVTCQTWLLQGTRPGTSSTTFELSIDGIQCGSLTTNNQHLPWTQLGRGADNPIILSGSEHTLTLRVSSTVAVAQWYVDDFSVIVVDSCPGVPAAPTY